MNWLCFNKLCLIFVIAALSACGGEKLIEDSYSLEYLEAEPGKPLVYPAGVDQPEKSKEYDIPKHTPKADADDYDVEEVLKPPRIVPLPKKEDD
jgi:uncharacterized lipoprotein